MFLHFISDINKLILNIYNKNVYNSIEQNIIETNK